MISDELLEEIINISLKGKYIDERIIKKIFLELYVQADDITKKNFRNLIFAKIPKSKNAKAICTPSKGIIVFDLQKIIEAEEQLVTLSPLANNLNIVVTLLHEFEHLKEPAKILNSDVESILIDSSKIVNERLYEELYYNIPNEKLAFTNSWEYLLESLKEYPGFEIKYHDEFKYVNNEFIKQLKLGYLYDEYFEYYNIPTFQFLNQTNQIDKLVRLKEMIKFQYSNIEMDSKTKLKYGLNISKQDIDEINKQKILK